MDVKRVVRVDVLVYVFWKSGEFCVILYQQLQLLRDMLFYFIVRNDVGFLMQKHNTADILFFVENKST